MKKSFFLTLTLTLVGIFVNAQVLYVPSGTGGIGVSTVAGNVGIGKTAPGAKLDIFGAISGVDAEFIRLSRDDGNRFNSIYSYSMDAGNAYISFRVHDGVSATSQANVMTLKGNGNVGIGTTSPATKLEVLSGLSNNEIARFGGTVSARGLRLSSFVVGGTNEVGFNFNAPGAGGAAAISFSTLSTERMIINYNGNVGIGTTTPFALLSLRVGQNLGFEVQGHADSRRWWLGNDYNSYGDFAINTESTQGKTYPDVTRFYINLLGNVGIGTTTPGSKLSFGSYQISSSTPSSSEQTSHIRLYESGSTFYGLGVSSGALNIAANQFGGSIKLYTNSSERLKIDGNGDAFFSGRMLLEYDKRLIVGYGNDINSRLEIVSSSEYKHTYIDFKKNIYFRAAEQTWICPLVLQWDGNVGIGFSPSYDENATHTQGYKLAVNGGILCEEVKVITDVPNSDYVFNSDYKLFNLKTLEKFIKENKHLPEVPSAEEFKKNGYKVGEMDDLLLRKIEELTLYVIELNKKIEMLEKATSK